MYFICFFVFLFVRDPNLQQQKKKTKQKDGNATTSSTSNNNANAVVNLPSTATNSTNLDIFPDTPIVIGMPGI